MAGPPTTTWRDGTSPSMTMRLVECPDVRKNPHSQSRRDCAARAAGVQGTRHPNRRRALDRGRGRHARAARRRERLHRPAARARQLSQRPRPAHRLRDHRRRRGASRLRLPVGERALCGDSHRARHSFHRAEARAYPFDGRQDRGQAHRREARHSGGARLRWRRRLRSGGASDGAGDRLSGADQGGRRRRWTRHEDR